MPRFLLIPLVVLGLVAQASPSRANAEWTDDENDATGVLVVESTPRPSDAELDILTSSFAVSGDSIVAKIRVKTLGVPVGAGGAVFHYRFKFKDDTYYFQGLTGSAEYQQLFLNNPRFYRENPDPTGDAEELKCDCKFATDPKTNSAVFTMKTAGLAKAIKGSVGSMEFGTLETKTWRRANSYIDVDISRAPEALKFTA